MKLKDPKQARDHKANHFHSQRDRVRRANAATKVDYPPGYFTELMGPRDPVTGAYAFPCGFVPQMTPENWRAGNEASLRATEARAKQLALGIASALGTVQMPGTPNTPMPGNLLRRP
jgi:hypothetical protein